ncbi:hypothetical protein FJT64_026171 [Amphibalanus amphitrite]|uniref:Uncharacterized protein n=1 Tax=Amphibalanus amphitrite TaxID=1232801 RepID=A0A6A4VYK6_AMPAM|nr:hypothetical protein FJT64_006643 [Amphibalanus amphitrite]KAF0301592.1 hypothetical protein FJT64_026171 [Amphibalanus amphitrite]
MNIPFKNVHTKRQYTQHLTRLLRASNILDHDKPLESLDLRVLMADTSSQEALRNALSDFLREKYPTGYMMCMSLKWVTKMIAGRIVVVPDDLELRWQGYLEAFNKLVDYELTMAALRGDEQPVCGGCAVPLTVAHVLLSCRRLEPDRTRYLGRIAPDITVRHLLGDESPWVLSGQGRRHRSDFSD